MLLRYFSALVIICALPCVLQAQVSRNPVANESDIKERLFALDTTDINYYFRVNLPGDNFLVIEFNRLSSWRTGDMLKDIFTAAEQTVSQVQDSFKYPSASKKIDIHIPAQGTPYTIRLFEHHEDGDLLVMKNGTQSPLKIGMDSVRILANITVTDKSVPAKVQYTFILKDLDQIHQLAANDMVIADAQKAFDDLVEGKRAKWRKQDEWHHNLDAVYDAKSTGEEKKLIVGKGPLFSKRFSTEFNVGVSLFQNTLAPYIDWGIYYKWPSSEKTEQYGYVAATVAGTMYFPQSETGVGVYTMGFYNLEMGTYYNKKNTRIPIYKTAMGIGYKPRTRYDPPFITSDLYRMYFKYSLSNIITIIPEFYYSENTFENKETNSTNFSFYTGITLAFKFLDF